MTGIVNHQPIIDSKYQFSSKFVSAKNLELLLIIHPCTKKSGIHENLVIKNTRKQQMSVCLSIVSHLRDSPVASARFFPVRFLRDGLLQWNSQQPGGLGIPAPSKGCQMVPLQGVNSAFFWPLLAPL